MRLVLDTNVVLDLVVFEDPGVRPLRAAIERGEAVLLGCDPCHAELRRVLAYPAFALSPAAQDAAYEWYRARASSVELPETRLPGMPACRDADDQKFLALAWEARADHLVTRDRALLDLARRVAKLGRFSIVSPQQLAAPVNSARCAR